MYAFSKRTVSQYLRGECLRRLRLDLYAGEKIRSELGIPDKDPARPGLALLVEQGRRFEREKFNELALVFPDLVVHGEPKIPVPGEETAFGKIKLADHIDACGGQRFLIEAEYEVSDPFIDGNGLRDLEDGSAFPAGGKARLAFSAVRPDIIEVVPTDGTAREVITVTGDVVAVPAGDNRLGLRVIDIKLTGEPSPSHFAELAYYGMTLASWLQSTGRDDRFVVLKDAAVWPGKHDASEIRRLETEDRARGARDRDLGRYLQGLQKDLETLPAEVVLGRVRRFFAFDLREAILRPDWSSLPWHVDSGCIGCNYLGYSWKAQAGKDDELPEETERSPYCWATAEANGHLSRVVGLTRGACGKLKDRQIESVSQLAALKPTSSLFEDHQKLRAGRTLFQARSNVLAVKGAPGIPARAGTSAILPARSDIKVALTVDFDVGSGLTFALGYRMLVDVPEARVVMPHGVWFRPKTARPEPRVMLVEQKSLDAERDVVTEFMRYLVDDILAAANRIRAARRALCLPGDDPDTHPTLQVYLWDRLTFDHLCRITGRHLVSLLAPSTDPNAPPVAPMAWLFPAEQVIEDADFTSANSPISILSDAVQALLAADVPHHYSLLGVANAYHPTWMDEERDDDERRFARREPGQPLFTMHPFFHDPLSDQIPSERGHEVWNKRSPFKGVDYQAYRDRLRRAVRTRTRAIIAVAERLTTDLKDDLAAAAPAVASVMDPTRALGAVATDGEILYQHARLMHAAQELEVDTLMAMPPHQREAVFESLRLEARLDGAERAQSLAEFGLSNLDRDDQTFVFRVSPRSVQSRIKKGEFNCSLMPESALGMQHWTIARLKNEYYDVRWAFGPPEHGDFRMKLRHACKVTVVEFDRVSRLIVLKASGLEPRMLPTLVQSGIFDFAVDGSKGTFAIVDPLKIDYFVRKRLRPALRAIRVPPLSRTRPLFRDLALTRLRLPRVRQTASVPAERFIWDADRLAGDASGRSGDIALAAIASRGTKLTDRQKQAVRQSVERRLSLLWGPPGTGKSTTAVALLHGLLADARHRKAPIRIAITGPTWVAIDTVAKKVPKLLRELGWERDVFVARLSSGIAGDESLPDELRDHVVVTDGKESHQALLERLDAGSATIVAGTATQLVKLIPDDGPALRPLFDFMLIDEASQMSVAHAVVAFTTLAEEASLTVVGDDLQMPPIQPVAAPQGAEHLVGSIYSFYRQYREGEPGAAGIEPVMLDRSYRSNKEIVDFVRLAGYGPELEADKKALRMRLATPLPSAMPADWPVGLPWHEHLAEILDPERPLIALIHPDEYSSQRNDHEADLVAGLVRTLHGRLLPEEGNTPLPGVEFFNDGIGIVTPHRAQQSAVVDRIGSFLPAAERAAMMATVDTVERFQGQEKTVMIASFGLGDRDQIAAEEEFLYSLNRFNVIASRAKAKLIVIVSRRLVDHLPRDPLVLRRSRLLKHYADGYLPTVMPAWIPGLLACEIKFK